MDSDSIWNFKTNNILQLEAARKVYLDLGDSKFFLHFEGFCALVFSSLGWWEKPCWLKLEAKAYPLITVLGPVDPDTKVHFLYFRRLHCELEKFGILSSFMKAY